jgi:succinate dehydrogenase/fumarate reductase cytochrome b subunit
VRDLRALGCWGSRSAAFALVSLHLPCSPCTPLCSPNPIPQPQPTPPATQKNEGFFVAGYIALTGDLPAALAAFRADHPILAVPAKFAIAWPLVYHYLGGLRHFVWDLHKIGNNADKTSLLEKDRVEESSKVLVAASLVLASVTALV